MARFSATWTNTTAGNWEAADTVTAANIQSDVGQNVEYIAQTHNHDGTTPGSGKKLALKDGVRIMWILGASGG